MSPLHPALVYFPIALVTFSFAADILGYYFHNDRLRLTGYYALIGGAIGLVLTVAAGYFDFTRVNLGETYKYVNFHTWTGWLLLISLTGLTIWRGYIVRRRDGKTSRSYLVMAAFILTLTLFQGWYGGEMVYSQGVGVAAANKGTEPSTNGLKRLEAVTVYSFTQAPNAFPQPEKISLRKQNFDEIQKNSL